MLALNKKTDAVAVESDRVANRVILLTSITRRRKVRNYAMGSTNRYTLNACQIYLDANGIRTRLNCRIRNSLCIVTKAVTITRVCLRRYECCHDKIVQGHDRFRCGLYNDGRNLDIDVLANALVDG